ncbi:MAG: hypothetical protein LCH79_16370 [Proteobacteria bacterium]|nr:hypothetical protein [Pseudomonadota bacterium]
MLVSDPAAQATAARIVEIVERNRLPLSNEKATQAALAELLKAAGIEHERECRLSGKDIPDFMIGGLAVELKIKGGKMDIYRQLKRYAEHDRVTRLLLVTGVAMGLPGDILNKPATMASLSRGWL